MNEINLANSGVVFDALNHTYHLNGKQLQGITGVLERRLFPHKYDGVDEEILEAARIRGTLIHTQCQEYDDLGFIGGDNPSEEAIHYTHMVKALGLVPVAREYLVTDGQHYASKIDAVYQGTEGGVVLNDLKTTYHLDKEYVSWQLSIYAWMFEKDNPTIKVEGLTATWLHGEEAEYVHIDRKDAKLVEALLAADIADAPFIYYPAADDVPAYIAERVAELRNLDAVAKSIKARTDTLKADILSHMEADHASTVKTSVATFSRTAPSSKYTFDADKFKAEHRDIYDEYCTKLTERKESLTIRFK